ncbi:MAG: BamA/TamA family outer membrane protein [Bacteroidaceae bacterium]|nr:BamA/TamA family outer membrane protein [Bacteroidaceae bacterium]
MTPRKFILILIATTLFFTGCSPIRFLKEDETMLHKVRISGDDKELDKSKLGGYVRQHPNSRWFSLLKVPLGVYCLSGTDSTRRFNRFMHRMGEAPVVYDSLSTIRAAADMEAAVRGLGYLQAEVNLDNKVHKRRTNVNYNIVTGPHYKVRHIYRRIEDSRLDSIINANWNETVLQEGMPFNINMLDEERNRITSLMQNMGFYYFNKTMIRFDADTTVGDHLVDIALNISRYKPSGQIEPSNHPSFSMRNVNFLVGIDQKEMTEARSGLDSTKLAPGIWAYHHGKMMLRPKFLLRRIDIHPGDIYSEQAVQNTYSSLASLSAVMNANVSLEPAGTRPDSLDAFVAVHTGKRHGLSAELEGTNSAGDLGAALSLGYYNRNLFRRSEQLSFKVRGAFEAIKGLKGYDDQNYIEYSAEMELNFPEFKLPFLSHRFHHETKAQSIASLMFDSQDRPEFHRRVLTAAWRYRWHRLNRKRQHRIDLIDLNYVFMPWISETFREEYLSDNSSRNAVLRYNYENLFIMKWGYSFQYTSVPTTSQNDSYGTNAYSVRMGIETAGNLLQAASLLLGKEKNEEKDAYTLFNNAYAQYVKFDFDFTKSFRFDDRNSLAVHLALGIAYPYANSKVLPYEKRYFSGGANSVRGWSVRGLGPGSFKGTDGRVDFIHQTGDMKLDMSMEYRTHLFWKMDAAAFVDAGNIWTLRNYEEQPGGKFRFQTFWKQIAASYGLGIRLNFSYFILRLDMGMKAVNPAYETHREHFPILYPNFKRDAALHFSVGLPF